MNFKNESAETESQREGQANAVPTALKDDFSLIAKPSVEPPNTAADKATFEQTQATGKDPDLQIKEAYEELMAAIRRHYLKSQSDLPAQEMIEIQRAFELAKQLHADMTRKSGEPYIVHPIEVATIVVSEIGLDTTSVVAALLHDVVEDTDMKIGELEANFGTKVAQIVDGLTKIRTVFKNKNVAMDKAENLRKLLLTLDKDIRVILIKIADRLHNMRTMDYMTPDKQRAIAEETFYIYVPIAGRLGLYSIKSELEDLSLKYTQREAYDDIANRLQENKEARQAYIKEFIKPIRQLLLDAGLKNFRIFGRPKHIYSIFTKMYQKRVEFEDICDLFAIRIVLESPTEGTEAEKKLKEHSDCYLVQTVIEGEYTPRPNRQRPWLAQPKSNGYEALHITVFDKNGRSVEVQIRSQRMDEVAEKGLAAHWLYKGGKSAQQFDAWMSGVRDLLHETKDGNAIEMVNNFMGEIFSSEQEIHVFTPKGDIKTLSEKATILDFAFAIHSDVGMHCIGGKIDGRLYGISHKLKNGDQIEIITSKNAHPSEDWLKIAQTNRARARIKSYVNHEREKNRRKIANDGKEKLERKLGKLKVRFSDQVVQELSNHFKFKDAAEFCCAIETEAFSLTRLKEVEVVGDKFVYHKEKDSRPISLEEEPYHPAAHNDNEELDFHGPLSLFLGFADKVEYSAAKCCNPKPGDPVYGFISLGQGIRIHRTDCPNATDHHTRYQYRCVSLRWSKQTDEVLYLAKLFITGFDDVGIVNRISTVISTELKFNMRAISFNAQDSIFEGRVEVYIKNKKELKLLMGRIKKIEGIYSVKDVGEEAGN